MMELQELELCFAHPYPMGSSLEQTKTKPNQKHENIFSTVEIVSFADETSNSTVSQAEAASIRDARQEVCKLSTGKP